MILNGKEYKVPEVKTFKDMVLLEAKGIKIMALTDMSFFERENLATSLVRGFSYYTGLSFEQALDEISEAIDNGETIEMMFDSMAKDIEEMKAIGATEGFSKGAKTPQDHKRPQKKVKTTEIPKE